MNILIARFNHETNTFSPVPTPLSAFSPAYGRAAYEADKGMRTAMAAFIELAEACGATLVTPVSATANPSGVVSAQAYEEITRRIVDAVPGCDAILLDLHGAMVAEGEPDGEGALLERVRGAAPGVPIGVALDLHGNITPRMVRNADVMVGFKTYPHVDMYETGEHAGRLLLEMLRGEARYTVCWKRLPLLINTLRSSTLSGAMKAAVEAAKDLERAGLPAVTVFGGFSLADIAEPGMSVVATSRVDQCAAAQDAVDALAARIWADRADYGYDNEPLATSIRRAQALAAGATRPVLLLDHGDNCMSGGTCDTMDVLAEALAQGLTGIAVGPICDPEAVAQLVAAGPGRTVEVALGNKAPLTAIGRNTPPLRLRGVVRAVSDGAYTITGPIYRGQRVHMGRTVCFDIGAAQIVVVEQTHEPMDLGVFQCVGIDATAFAYLLLKSRMYCRPVFGPLSSGLVECDSGGVTTADHTRFRYRNVVRPVYPFDPM